MVTLAWKEALLVMEGAEGVTVGLLFPSKEKVGSGVLVAEGVRAAEGEDPREVEGVEEGDTERLGGKVLVGVEVGEEEGKAVLDALLLPKREEGVARGVTVPPLSVGGAGVEDTVEEGPKGEDVLEAVEEGEVTVVRVGMGEAERVIFNEIVGGERERLGRGDTVPREEGEDRGDQVCERETVGEGVAVESAREGVFMPVEVCRGVSVALGEAVDAADPELAKEGVGGEVGEGVVVGDAVGVLTGTLGVGAPGEAVERMKGEGEGKVEAVEVEDGDKPGVEEGMDVALLDTVGDCVPWAREAEGEVERDGEGVEEGVMVRV